MLVHRCDRCCVYKKEIQHCRTKYRGIWALLMHKMMFPSESCNSVSNGTFCEFRPFSVIAENHWPYTPHTQTQVRLMILSMSAGLLSSAYSEACLMGNFSTKDIEGLV